MLDVNTAASNEGFSVKALGRGGLEYKEGPKSAFVDSEMSVGNCGIVVWKDSFNAWMPPFVAEPVSEDDRDRVLDNIRRAFEFQKVRVVVLDNRLSAEENQRAAEAADARDKMPVVRSPRVGILDLGGAESAEFIASDTIFLSAIFGQVRTVDLADTACDVLVLYAKLAADGTLIGSPLGLVEIIRDSGARIVVFGLGNSSSAYIEAGKRRPWGTANFIETLDRRGDAFERFLTGVFETMRRGASMCTALGYASAYPPGSPGCDRPLAIISPELDPFTFGD